MGLDLTRKVHLLIALEMICLTLPPVHQKSGDPAEGGDIKLLHLVNPHMIAPEGGIGHDQHTDVKPERRPTLIVLIVQEHAVLVGGGIRDQVHYLFWSVSNISVHPGSLVREGQR